MSTQAASPGPGRVNQKARTRAAILQAVRELTRTGGEISMPAVARAALVSEATAYRYFPDLASLLMEADTDAWPDPAQALAPVAGSTDPVERVGYAAEFLLTGILARQSVVRAMIAATITRPDLAASRPGHRFALIDYALAPLATANPAALAQLKQGLSVVMSAEALFVLTDLCGLSPPDAVASAVRTARTLTAAALAECSSRSLRSGSGLRLTRSVSGPGVLVEDELGHPGQRVVQVLRGHHVGYRQPDSGQLPGQVLGIGLGPVRHVPVALDVGPVPVVLPVLGQQDERRGVGGLGREGQVEQDERVRVPVLDQADGVEDDPEGHHHRLPEQEAPGAQEPRDRLGEPAEYVGVVAGAHSGGAARDGQVGSLAQAAPQRDP
jgi:AcrR family transcriptional regulator